MEKEQGLRQVRQMVATVAMHDAPCWSGLTERSWIVKYDLLCTFLPLQALRTMGMTDGAYWASWGAWEVTLAFITGHLITIFGGCPGHRRNRWMPM
jgi:hypothetical protein